MNRLLVLAAATVGLVAVACGSAATAANTASPSPSAGRGGAQFRNNGASGQLVQINGQNLILTGPSGDLTVTVSTTTTFTRTSTAVLADIVPGDCILATGQKDSAGLLTATTVRLSPKTASGCAAAGRFGPNGSPPPGASPPQVSPRPTPSGLPPMAFVTGEVTGAAGISITVLTTTSGSQTITVPTTAAVTTTVVGSATDLQTGECVRATGARDSAGSVQATSITITPAGPNGTCVTGFGGRGGGGGGGFGRPGATPGAAAG
jgi:hypothetical protein